MAEAKEEMTRRQRVLLSVFFALVSLTCFLFLPASESRSVSTTTAVSRQENRTETTSFERPGLARMVELLGIGSLLLAVWLWRRELGITQLGPLGGADPVSQQEAGSPPKPPDESGPPPAIDLSNISAEMADAEAKQRLKHIMQMFQRLHSVNVSHVARELGVTTHTAKAYLFLLTKTGQLRADGFPRRTIYTPAKSLENRILDTVKQKLSQTYGVLAERRYVRVKRSYEVDSLLESDDVTFIVEAKVLRTDDVVPRLDNWILQLLSVAKELPSRRPVCVLSLACVDEARPTVVKKQVESMTFDSGSIPVEVMVLAQSELIE
jgi:hypothetical protein